ncbi:hypothetical protein [Nesterenkonia ebinurensis]|uniref:hypothetical protein n=1 Tax=Nesterenkonia ebinurensis TaxID=2608252 RepID=UPI00123D8D90|nr:hypothetical protein [Nesterenkonia ebinurensis]
MRNRTGRGVVVLIFAATVTACGAEPETTEPEQAEPSPPTNDPTGNELPDEDPPPEEPELETRAEILDEDTLELVTYGSSTCPDEVTEVEATDAGTLAVELHNPHQDGPCTADYAPTEHIIEIPGEVTERPVTLELEWKDSDHTDTITAE